MGNAKALSGLSCPRNNRCDWASVSKQDGGAGKLQDGSREVKQRGQGNPVCGVKADGSGGGRCTRGAGSGEMGLSLSLPAILACLFPKGNAEGRGRMT